MQRITELGQVPWTREDLKAKLETFSHLYDERPIRDNQGGMKSPHVFLVWFALQWLQPEVIIESGVWRGLGTWFFERACPNAKIYALDIDFSRLDYKSPNVTYLQQDFTTIDWRALPKESTLLFFDDHQNAYERIKAAQWFGFKHLIFEDNYDALHGDCYSLKKAFMGSGFTPQLNQTPSLLHKARAVAKRLLKPASATVIPPNTTDALYLEQNLEIYHEFSPVFKPTITRWGDAWTADKYPTPEPLLTALTEPYQQNYFDEAAYYTWMCYAKLK